MHLGVLDAAGSAGLHFQGAQIIATFIAMLANFFLNNAVTYRRRTAARARPWWPRGWPCSSRVCSLGAVANVGIARTIYAANGGWTPAALVGAAIGMVWNYAISATLVWNRRTTRPQAAPVPAGAAAQDKAA